jgi:MSHA biogenesis protein MshM
MYLEHFRLKEFPFGITPDTSFYFSSTSAQQALNTLLVAIRSGEGFIKITGEVGTGKTLLCRQLLLSLGSDFQTAYVPNPYLTPHGLLLELAEELGVDMAELRSAAESQAQHLLLKALNQRLLDLARDDKPVLVCLDEVQAMPIETLEALRLLTNLETERRKLVQVVIFGQPELDEKLDHPSIRQLKQRITFDYHLGPLMGAELARYLDHRMTVAGYDGARLFSRPALWILKWRTRGFPRLVNVVAHKALMSSYGRGKQTIGLREMHEAIVDTASVKIRGHGLVLRGLALVLFCMVAAQLARSL